MEGLEVYLEQKLSRAEWIDIKADYVTLSKFAVQDSGEYVLTLDIELEADDKPKVALVLTVVHESDDKEIYYEAQRIDGLLKHDACTKMRSYKLRFEEPVEVHFYLFNIEEKRFTVHAVENRILRVIKT
ncbi:MAG: hypothetical protein KC456_13885 [Flavobacteriales bacterium]|nr:hypothetical protein [Flavobacteriales bacterium]